MSKIECDVCGCKECILIPCGDHFHYLCAKCVKVVNPLGDHWQCEACGTVYAEYVNGCSKCSEKGLIVGVVNNGKLLTL